MNRSSTIILIYLFLYISLNLYSKERIAPDKLLKVSMVENEKGIGFGFWCNNKYRKEAFLDFGRRAYERSGFYSWSNIEKNPGVYDIKTVINDVRNSHRLGSNCIIALNSISGPWFNQKIKSKIPEFYPQDITNPQTRSAAKRYIYTVVKSVLPEVGELWVSFDYEIMWHCRPDTPQKQQMYRDWYLEAVAVARLAAKAVNMESRLKIMPIVNGATDDKTIKPLLNSSNINHKPAQWLLDVVSVSDFLAIDSYDFDINDPTSPKKTIQALEFWIKNYSEGKPVQITEFGYSTGNTYFPDFKTHYHACGTEQQQAEFYKRLFPMLVVENVKGKALNGQLRSFQFWMYSDMKTNKANYKLEDHFGFIRMDKSRKPAFDVLQKEITNIEGNLETSTSKIRNTETISKVKLKSGIPFTYDNGTNYDYLSCDFEKNKLTGDDRLFVEVEYPGVMLIENNGRWNLIESGKNNSFEMPIDKNNIEGKEINFNLYFTGSIFPYQQVIKDVYILK